jgi:hypothetical protein
MVARPRRRGATQGVTFLVAPAVATGGLIWHSAAPAHAASVFEITANGDPGDQDLTDRACLTQDGTCTLRPASEQANAETDKSTIINPAARTITLARWPPAIRRPADLLGDGNLTVLPPDPPNGPISQCDPLASGVIPGTALTVFTSDVTIQSINVGMFPFLCIDAAVVSKFMLNSIALGLKAADTGVGSLTGWDPAMVDKGIGVLLSSEPQRRRRECPHLGWCKAGRPGADRRPRTPRHCGPLPSRRVVPDLRMASNLINVEATPLGHRCWVAAHLGGDLTVQVTVSKGQHDLGAPRQRLPRRVALRPTLRRDAFLNGQDELRGWPATTCHGVLLMLHDITRPTRHHRQRPDQTHFFDDRPSRTVGDER